MLRRSPKVYQSPTVLTPNEPPKPITHQTCYHLKVSPLDASSRTFPYNFLQGCTASEVLHSNQWSPLALSVLEPKTGQSLEHQDLQHHPQMGADWNKSYSNELVHLCQGIGADPTDPAKQRVKGTNIFHAICYDDIPLDR